MTEYIQDEPQGYDPADWPAEKPILVKSVSEGPASPEFSSCMTWQIPQAGIGQPVQILQRRICREKAKIFLVNLNGATAIALSNVLAPIQGNNPQGAQTLALTFVIEWESQQPCYAIALGGGPAVVSVIDETYAER
jgi:hypothetical protein